MKRIIVLLTLISICLGLTFAQEEEPVVLRLGERSMTVAEFNQRFEIALRGLLAQTGQPFSEALLEQYAAFKPQLLEQLALEFVLFSEAEERELLYAQEDLEAEIAQMKAQTADEESFVLLLEQMGINDEATLRELIFSTESARNVIRQIQEGIEISEEDVQAYYETNSDGFQSEEAVCARHILLDTEEEALEVAETIAGGMDFAEAAAEFSTGPSGPDGGDLDCFGRGRMVAPFDEAAFAANLDEVTGPVETQFGFHLILVYDQVEAGPIPLDDVAAEIEQELFNQAIDQSIGALREASGLEVFEDNIYLEVGSPDESDSETGDATTEETESTEDTGSEDTGSENTGDDSSEDEEGSDGEDTGEDTEEGGEEDEGN